MRDGEPMCWTVRFDPGSPLHTLAVSGHGCAITDTPTGKQAVVSLPYSRHVLVDVTPTTTRIHSGTAVLPVYARSLNRQVLLSNRAAELLNRNEETSLRTFVLVQQLLGANYPQNNIFADIDLLEANADYEILDGRITYKTSLLTKGEQTNGAGALQILYDNVAAVAESGKPLCVLLSGGYDSRFNLAIAMAQARRFGNSVYAYHEYKNDEEFHITRAVAEHARVPLHCESRASFTTFAETTIFDPAFIRFHSGMYRDNIPRWHGYLNRIRSDVGDGIILGHGAEGHKGKFYRHIRNVRRDSERVFGADSAKVLAAARVLGLREFDPSSQRRFFAELCSRAGPFEDDFAKIDFIHYQTYVVNGYAHRTYDFQQFFDIPFPFLDPRFLAAVFALPADAKRDFKLVKTGLADLAPGLMGIPFISGNDKALSDPAVRWERFRERLGPIRRLKNVIFGGPARRPLAASAVDRARRSAGRPRSEVTDRLLRVVLGGGDQALVSPTYALQAFLYLRLLEDERGVTFRCV